jgi:hypothetical protein
MNYPKWIVKSGRNSSPISSSCWALSFVALVLSSFFNDESISCPPIYTDFIKVLLRFFLWFETVWSNHRRSLSKSDRIPRCSLCAWDIRYCWTSMLLLLPFSAQNEEWADWITLTNPILLNIDCFAFFFDLNFRKRSAQCVNYIWKMER